MMDDLRCLGPEATFAVQTIVEALHIAPTVEQEAAASALKKSDASPVTVADFGVQALVGARLARDFPNDSLVAEEDSSALRAGDAADLKARVTGLVRRVDERIRPDQVLEWIDRGAGTTGRRFWALDPVDGTKGLLRGGQFVIALALIESGAVQLGVLGCPRLALGEGGVAVAVRGRGAWWGTRVDESFMRLSVSDTDDPACARVLHSFEAAHSDVERLQRVLRTLGTSAPPVLMDSQAKHVVVASGGADVLLRFPKDAAHHDSIWDQAAGSVLIEEAGGRVTDLLGRSLDFSTGRRLLRNEGLVASNGVLHETVLAAVRQSTGC